MLLDLTADGLALQAPEPLPPIQAVPVRFVLPGTSYLIEGMGEVIWADDSGRAGVVFKQLAAASSKYLRAWLAKRDSNRKTTVHATPGAKRRRVAQAASR